MICGTGGYACGESNLLVNVGAGVLGAVNLSKTNWKSGWAAGARKRVGGLGGAGGAL
jgi:hypothetical protein